MLLIWDVVGGEVLVQGAVVLTKGVVGGAVLSSSIGAVVDGAWVVLICWDVEGGAVVEGSRVVLSDS